MGRRTSPGGALAAAKRVEKQRTRERSTGRYAHEWGVIGSGNGRESVECQDCGKVYCYGEGEGADRTYADREKARAAGEPMFEGY